MFHSLFYPYWAIAESSIDSLTALIRNIMKAGPIEEGSNRGLPVEKVGKVAVVKTEGPVIKYAGSLQRWGLAGIRETQGALTAAANDSDVDQILWMMDTPGGTVDGLMELAETVARVNARKKITVQVDGMLASAGYFIAANASEIYAAPDDLIGSIGVRTALYDLSEMFKEMGVKAIPVDTGEHKSAGLRGTEITDSQIAEVQRIVDGYMNSFRQVVTQGRQMNRAQFDAVADGRVFFPRESIELGLIDGVRTANETLNTLVQSSRPQATRHRAELDLIKLGA